MKGSEEKLLRFMEGSKKRFVIPVYQRNYDWRTEHCKQLFDDLIKVAKQGRKTHFFGSIVSVYNPDGPQDEFLIIDGQQRLTTVSLLLLAIYNLISGSVITPVSRHLGQQIYEDYLVDKWQPEETRVKLKPIKNDQAAFSRLFDSDANPIRESNLTINYGYFFDRIQSGEVGPDELFDAISKLEIINISLNHDDNPQLIFESLNSTGLDLSEGDKIRNYILMGQLGKQQEKLYEKYWNPIERCTAYDVSSFIRDYLSIKQQSTPNIKNVYVRFKEFSETSAFADTEALLADMYGYAKRYEVLLKGNAAQPALNDIIFRLNRLKTTVIRPFMMEAIRMKECGKLTAVELVEVFSLIEVYLFRRSICDVPTNALNKVFLMLHREIVRLDGTEDSYLDKLKYMLRSKKESSRFPDDPEFLEALSTRNIYMMRGESKMYLFERLENAGTAETKDVWTHFDNGDYSIEHIMPQQLSPGWMNSLGEDGENIHEIWLHRLANLTMTAYNSKYSNHPFAEKRDMENGFKKSGLRINQWIGQRENWGIDELEERNELLRQSALTIWEYPESTYQPPQKQLDMVALDDDVALTGEDIVRFSLHGVEQPTTSWTDMYQRVLIQLHAEDKSVLMQLALCNDANVELAPQFSALEDGLAFSKRIDKDVYANTNTSTQQKVNMLRKIFELYGADPSALLFYLRGDGENVSGATGNRYDMRKQYWAYALPVLRDAVDSFANVNPSRSNWINGYIGNSGVHLTCVANFDAARTELWLEMAAKEKNKQLFDHLFAHKGNAEEAAGCSFLWSRADENKTSKIYLAMGNVSVANEADWARMAEFNAQGCKALLQAFLPILKEYFKD